MAVELAINSDERRHSIGWRDWENLTNVTTLNKALQIGCPVTLLLEPDEFTNGTIRSNPKPIFIQRRNKYAHGEWTSSFMPHFSVDYPEKEALDQLLKCQNFLMEWAASEGNPIIASDNGNEQQRSIGQETTILKMRAPAASLRIEFFNPWSMGRWY
jgi:hypothetical protein